MGYTKLEPAALRRFGPPGLLVVDPLEDVAGEPARSQPMTRDAANPRLSTMSFLIELHLVIVQKGIGRLYPIEVGRRQAISGRR